MLDLQEVPERQLDFKHLRHIKFFDVALGVDQDDRLLLFCNPLIATVDVKRMYKKNARQQHEQSATK